MFVTGIHSVPPREVAGRDMTLRVSMQHQAAAFAALQILKGGEVDRVYCDYHDDFVVRYRSNVAPTYHFFQVKTKGKKNYQWTLLDIFSLKKTKQGADKASLEAVEKSFAGRLIRHSITFGESCRAATLLTNVHFSDEVEAVVAELGAGLAKTKAIDFFIKNFDTIFGVHMDQSAALAASRKLSLQSNVTHIGDMQKDFAVAAREAIYQYSEIDLEHREANEIASDLVWVVNKKSTAPIQGMTPNDLDDKVGVGIGDLLAVLSISTEAYHSLVAGDDPKALRTASYIQRKLKAAGATDGMIEFASQKKVEWDVWLRSARHIYVDFELNFLLQRVDNLRAQWMLKGGQVLHLRDLIDAALSEEAVSRFSNLTKDLLFGGVVAAFVRHGSA